MHPSNLLSAMAATGGVTDDLATIFTHGVTGDLDNPTGSPPTTSPGPSQPRTYKDKSMDELDRRNWLNPADWFGMHEEEQYRWRARELAEEGKDWHPHYPGNESNPSGIGALPTQTQGPGSDQLTSNITSPTPSPGQPQEDFVNYDAFKPHGGLSDEEISDMHMQQNTSGLGSFIYNYIDKPVTGIMRGASYPSPRRPQR